MHTSSRAEESHTKGITALPGATMKNTLEVRGLLEVILKDGIDPQYAHTHTHTTVFKWARGRE